MNSSHQIQQMVSNLFKELIDKRTIKKLGTSIEQHMSRDYQKKIEEKFIQLKNEFNSMDYNEDSFLSVDEIYNFFSSKNPNIRKEEIQTLFAVGDDCDHSNGTSATRQGQDTGRHTSISADA